MLVCRSAMLAVKWAMFVNASTPRSPCSGEPEPMTTVRFRPPFDEANPLPALVGDRGQQDSRFDLTSSPRAEVDVGLPTPCPQRLFGSRGTGGMDKAWTTPPTAVPWKPDGDRFS